MNWRCSNVHAIQKWHQRAVRRPLTRINERLGALYIYCGRACLAAHRPEVTVSPQLFQAAKDELQLAGADSWKSWDHLDRPHVLYGGCVVMPLGGR